MIAMVIASIEKAKATFVSWRWARCNHRYRFSVVTLGERISVPLIGWGPDAGRALASTLHVQV